MKSICLPLLLLTLVALCQAQQYLVSKSFLRPTQAAQCDGKVQKYGIFTASSCSPGSCNIDEQYIATSTSCATTLDTNYVPVVGDQYAATLSYGTFSDPATGCSDISKFRTYQLVRIGECIQDSSDSFSLVLKNTTHISYFSGFPGYGSGICSGQFTNLYEVPIGSCSEANTGYWNRYFVTTGSTPTPPQSSNPQPAPGPQTGSASSIVATVVILMVILVVL